MIEKEVWKDIQGYEGKYQVSNLGNVKSLNYRGTGKERMLKTKKLRNSRTAERSVLQFTNDGKFVKEFPSTHEATRCTGINHGNICSCFKGRRTTAGGYIWKYKNNE